MSGKSPEELAAIAGAALAKIERPASQRWREEICQTVQEHIDAGTTANSFGAFWDACASTLQKKDGVTMSANAMQKQYGAWREETGVDERAYVNGVSLFLLLPVMEREGGADMVALQQIEAQQKGFKAGEMRKAIGEVDREEAKPGFGAE